MVRLLLLRNGVWELSFLEGNCCTISALSVSLDCSILRTVTGSAELLMKALRPLGKLTSQRPKGTDQKHTKNNAKAGGLSTVKRVKVNKQILK